VSGTKALAKLKPASRKAGCQLRPRTSSDMLAATARATAAPSRRHRPHGTASAGLQRGSRARPRRAHVPPTAPFPPIAAATPRQPHRGGRLHNWRAARRTRVRPDELLSALQLACHRAVDGRRKIVGFIDDATALHTGQLVRRSPREAAIRSEHDYGRRAGVDLDPSPVLEDGRRHTSERCPLEVHRPVRSGKQLVQREIALASRPRLHLDGRSAAQS
jgi:hypothetical protein